MSPVAKGMSAIVVILCIIVIIGVAPPARGGRATEPVGERGRRAERAVHRGRQRVDDARHRPRPARARGTASMGLIVTSDQPLMAERELDFAGGATGITVTTTYVAYTSMVNRATQTLEPVTKTVDYPVAAGGLAPVAVNQDVASIITYRLGDGTFEDRVSATVAASGPSASGGFAAAITNSSYDGQTQVQQPIFPFMGTLGVALEEP